MARRGRVGFAAGLTLAVAALTPPAHGAGGGSLTFGGGGWPNADQIRIRVDDPMSTTGGPAVDVGASQMTIEMWVKGSASHNTTEEIVCGDNDSWLLGNVLADRDRVNQGRGYGLSVAGGMLVFGVKGSRVDDLRTICGSTRVLDGRWHHVAAQFRAADGAMSIWVDGELDATGTGPAHDISYPDDGVPGFGCGGMQCSADPFLSIGAAKQHPNRGFRGSIDELRISSVLRYSTRFTPASKPFDLAAGTVGLWHFDDGAGTVALDVANAPGGPSHAELLVREGSPAWSAQSAFAAPTPGGAPTGGGKGGDDDDDGGKPGGGGGAGPRETSSSSVDDTGLFTSSEQQGGAPHAKRLSDPRPYPSQLPIPPLGIALVGLGVAIALGAHFLRTERSSSKL